MKKLVLVMLAVFLVLPALSNAGSVSSRYDVTFGGFVKYDLGWSSQNQSADPTWATRNSAINWEYLSDEYGNTFATGAETRFNFLVKGPDLWGAKTSAFIEGDFRGTTTGNAHGGFQLRHAFMNLKWDSAELMIGQNWQQWGMPYYPAMIGANDFAAYLKGIRTPQIAFRYFFTKEFNAMIGVTSATEWSGATRQFNDGFARSSWPGLQGEIAYWTDRCGKIGPNNLKFALGGVYGQEKMVFPALGAPAANSGITIPPALATSYQDDSINAWLVAFRYSIPIIPEKQNNKQFALLLNGNFFYGQDPGGNNWLAPGTSSSGYWRFPASAVPGPFRSEAAAPTLFGLYAQASFWFTNNLWINGMYGYLKYNYSSGARADNPNLVNMQQAYALNLLWDANQAIRFGVQWMSLFTGYNQHSINVPGVFQSDDRTGVVDQYRFAAWYFF